MRALNILTSKDGKGKGKGAKGDIHFVMWWPFRASDPSFSIQYKDKVVLSSAANFEGMEQNIMVNTEHGLELESDVIVQKIKEETHGASGLFPVTVETMKNPKAFGRRPKQ
jgi:hypothetical protein